MRATSRAVHFGLYRHDAFTKHQGLTIFLYPLHLCTTEDSEVVLAFVQHYDWHPGEGWKTWLNNLRLVLLPWVSANLLRLWQRVFPIPELERGFEKLIELMNQFRGAFFGVPYDISSA